METIAEEMIEMNRIGRWNFMLEMTKAKLTQEEVLDWTEEDAKKYPG